MKKLLLSLYLLLAAMTAAAKSPCDEFAPYGYPIVSYSVQVLCRTSYLQLHNNETKTGGIALEYLTPTTVGTGNEPRTNNFRADIEVPREARATPEEYVGTGFDKGHIAAAGNMREDGKSMSQSFFMSNMAPQFPNHNRGIWRGLELLVRDWVVKERRNLYVITGTSFVNSTGCLPDAKSTDRRPVSCQGSRNVHIPGSFFKVIIDKERGDAVAFLIPNQPADFKKLSSYRLGVCDLEKAVVATGRINLLPDATPAERAKLCSASGATFKDRVR